MQCESSVQKLYDGICKALKPSNASEALLHLIGFWPRCTLLDILGLLATVNGLSIDEQWTNCLLELGKAVTIYQRARRLVMAAESGKTSSFFSEVENVGCMDWDAKEHPDWLLIEIQNDFLIRQVQARVAQEMIAPASSSNSLTQLNMGVRRPTVVLCCLGLTKLNQEGKSSVIVPIVAVALADGSQLSRVLVLYVITALFLPLTISP